MMDNLKKTIFSRLWMVLLFTALFVVSIATAFDFYYDLNDDTTIKDIVSGAYTGTPSGYSVQMLYPLSFCVSLFYRAIPGVSWYGLFLCVCQFGAFALIAWRATGLVKKQWQQFVVLVCETIVFLGLLIRQLVFVQYSVTSGICMATAIFLYLTEEEKESPRMYLKQNKIPILLVILAFMIRTEMCLMLMPFLLLAGLSKWMTQERKFTIYILKRYFYVIGVAVLGMLVMLVIDKVSISLAAENVEWKSFQNFFKERTKMCDYYGLPSYEENYEFYQEIGFSRQSYEVLKNYNISLDDSIDEYLLKQIMQYQEEMAGKGENLAKTGGFVSRNSLQEAIWLYKNSLLNVTENSYVYLLLAAYISFLLLATRRSKSKWCLKIIFLWIVRSVLWIYLFMIDRTVERVICPLQVMEIMVLLGWIMQEREYLLLETKNGVASKIQVVSGYVLLVLCATVVMCTNIQKTAREYENRESVNSRWKAFITYCEERDENYYVMDVFSSMSYEGIPYSEKIFESIDNSYRNFDLCGGWLSKSPLMYKKLAKMHIEDLENALCDMEKVYFVADPDKDMTWLKEYYAYKGKTIKLESVDTIYDGRTECFIVYQLN